MAITLLQKQKIQKYLILAFIAVLIIIVFVLWLGYRKKEDLPPQEVFIVQEEVRIDFEVLKNPLLQELEVLEKIEPFAEEAGRENPFLPF